MPSQNFTFIQQIFIEAPDLIPGLSVVLISDWTFRMRLLTCTSHHYKASIFKIFSTYEQGESKGPSSSSTPLLSVTITTGSTFSEVKPLTFLSARAVF